MLPRNLYKRGAFFGGLGERLNGIQEVMGSIPTVSTKNDLFQQVVFYSLHFYLASFVLSLIVVSGGQIKNGFALQSVDCMTKNHPLD